MATAFSSDGQTVLGALRERPYRQLWLAGIAVNTARWMDILILGWLALALTDSPFMVGVAAFARAAPMMGLGPLAGVVADRFHRGRVLAAVQGVNLAGGILLAVGFGLGTVGFPALVAIEILLGVAWAVDYPVRRTVLFTLVEPARLTNAVSLEALSMQGSKMLGPLVGGVLLARGGPVAAYLVMAGLYLTALIQVARLARTVSLPGTPGLESVAASLVAGLREVRARPAIRAVLGVTVVMNALVFPYQPMLPVFARDVLGVGPGLLGLLVAAEGLGAMAGALAVAGRGQVSHHVGLFVGASLATAALLLAFTLSPWYLASLALQLGIGLTESGFGTMQSTIVMLAAPAEARGRAMGILSACIGTQPLGTLWLGFLAGRIGAPVAAGLGAAAAILLMLPLAVRAARADRRLVVAG